jgi:uncharacterized repeat protein (TIGR01451 family)
MKLFNVGKLIATALAATLLLASAAWAAPQVTLSIKAEKDIVVEEDGKKVTKRVAAEDAIPGEVIIYTIAFANIGDEKATNVLVDDPIPAGTAYVTGSATEVGEVLFSIDGGQSYKRPSLLTYEIAKPDGTKEMKVASPEQYTHIRWRLAEILPGTSGELSFRVKVQ